jgi:hypothetical protein
MDQTGLYGSTLPRALGNSPASQVAGRGHHLAQALRTDGRPGVELPAAFLVDLRGEGGDRSIQAPFGLGDAGQVAAVALGLVWDFGLGRWAGGQAYQQANTGRSYI